MFDKDQCINCGTCLASCPIIEMDINQAKIEIENLINGSSLVVDQCAVCGTCDLNCPENLTPMELIMELKYEKMNVLKEKDQIPQMMKLILPFEKRNIFQIYENTMMPPESKQKLEKWKSPKKSEELILLGCAISYLYQDFYDNPTVNNILQGKNVAGGLEYCCGEIYHRLCYPISKTEIEENLFAKFTNLGTNELLIFCNECHEAYRNQYKKIARDFKITSMWKYIADKIEAGDIKITNKLDYKVVYQDPCAAKKYPEILDAPRKIIEATGAEIIELEHNRENALCCGLAVGLNGMSAMNKIRKKRMDEIINTGSEYIINTCPGCILNFAMDRKVRRGKFKVISVLELLRLACGEKIELDRHPKMINDLLNKTLSIASEFTPK